MISKKISFVILTLVFGLLTLDSGEALAKSNYLNSFNSQYGTSGTALDDCSLCHPSQWSRNSYGRDYSNGHNFTNIEGLDSDGDGFVNLDEINARTFPGNASSVPATLPTCTDSDRDGFAVEGGNCGTVDCNDSRSSVYPGAPESCTDNIDNNCNGLIDNQDPLAVNCPPVCTDLDGDGYAIEGGNCGQVDCNDSAPLVNPGAVENCSDNIDNDCDSLVDVMDPNAVNCPVTPPTTPNCTDNDTDGFSIEGGDCGLVDCNDADPAIHPDAAELCTDSVDNDCDGLVNFADPNAVGCPVGCTDLDLDGYAVEGGDCGPVDCNDEDEFINPAAVEECTDGIDNDCNDLIDFADPNVVNCPTGCTDADNDGYAVNGDACGQIDCSDSDTSIHPGATEICGDGIDQDCDGSDLSCAAVILPPTISLNVSGVNVSVSWSAVAGATGYTLSYAPYPYTGPQSIASVDVGQVTSVSYDLWHGAAFNVAVQAYNVDGSSSYSNIEYFTIESGNDDVVPVAPNISLTLTGLNVSISWPAVADATGYTIFYAPNPYGGPQSFNSADLGNKTSVSYELWAGASYTVAVQAYNDHGNSDYSNIEAFVIASSVEVPNPVDGAQLYATNCASCHGSLSTSNVGGEDAGDIEEAIEENEGGMGFLSFLGSDQIRAIASVLAGVDDD